MTCPANSRTPESFVSFAVQGKMVLVLDRKSVDEGQIMGVLREGDVACASLMELPWVMLPAASYARHATVREGRIKLQKPGWMLCNHAQYGDLLVPLGAEKVRRYFEEDAFAKIPLVKLSKHDREQAEDEEDPVASLPQAQQPQQLPQPAASMQPAPVAVTPIPLDPVVSGPYPSSTAVIPSTGAHSQSASSTALAPRAPRRKIRAQAPAELLEQHLERCWSEHWRVVHNFVFVRMDPSTTAEQLGVVRQGSVICLGSLRQETRSFDESWVRCSPDSKVWPTPEVETPEWLSLGRSTTGGYILIKSEELGDLLRLVPNSPSGPPPKKALQSPQPLPREVAQRPSVGSPLQSPQSAAAKPLWQQAQDGPLGFMTRRPSGHGEVQLPTQDTEEFAREDHWPLAHPTARHAESSDSDFTVKVLAAFGEPWVVEHEQVVVRRGPSTDDMPLGIMLKGDVAGVRRRKGDWVELMQDSEVRFRKKGPEGSATTDLGPINPIREQRVPDSPARRARRNEEREDEKRTAPDTARAKAWMLVEHPTLGQLLRRARKRKGGLSVGCVLGKLRGDLYREVVELCHRRIYEENLQGLWDGDREKLPSLETVEAKIFDGHSTVVHVSHAGRFAGGAIVKRFSVRARCIEGTPNLNFTAGKSDTPERSGRTVVGYIDVCAAEPGTHTGRVIWETVTTMRFVCVTCHSILLQKTVDFWQACGMRRLDPASERDCEEFKRLILVHTMGKVTCELADVQEVLPHSKLPLFVWVPSRFSQVTADPNSDYIFRPDASESWDQ